MYTVHFPVCKSRLSGQAQPDPKCPKLFATAQAANDYACRLAEYYRCPMVIRDSERRKVAIVGIQWDRDDL
jgi:hypothetical protein